jgi:FAD/FMN-containing dehydrogenase
VLADGSVIKTGGRVVKNVAGYDLSKLFTGSLGTLGVIAELNFKLRPRPECERTVAICGLLSDLPAKARSIISAGLFPVAAEIVSPAFAALLGIAVNQPVMLVRFAGNEVAVKYQIERTLALSGDGEVITEDAPVWEQIAAAPLQMRQSFSWRASMLPTKVGAFSEDVERIYRDSFAAAIWQIGAADGRVRMMDNVDYRSDEKSSMIERLRAATKSTGGSLVIDSEMHSVPSDPLTQRVKRQLDPMNVFG